MKKRRPRSRTSPPPPGRHRARHRLRHARGPQRPHGRGHHQRYQQEECGLGEARHEQAAAGREHGQPRMSQRLGVRQQERRQGGGGGGHRIERRRLRQSQVPDQQARAAQTPRRPDGDALSLSAITAGASRGARRTRATARRPPRRGRGTRRGCARTVPGGRPRRGWPRIAATRARPVGDGVGGAQRLLDGRVLVELRPPPRGRRRRHEAGAPPLPGPPKAPSASRVRPMRATMVRAWGRLMWT